MRRRYQILNKEEIFEAFNRLRDAFLAARDGSEVDTLTDGLLTHDEKLKIGRRILIAEYLIAGYPIEEISKLLKVGRNTVMHVKRRLEKYEGSFKLIERRRNIVEKEYRKKSYKSVGGPKLIFKKKDYTGFKRKDVKRQ